MVRHLCPVYADLHVNLRPVSVHAVYEAFVERLRSNNSCQFNIYGVKWINPANKIK